MDGVDSSYVRPNSLPKSPLALPRGRTFVKSQAVHDKLSTSSLPRIPRFRSSTGFTITTKGGSLKTRNVVSAARVSRYFPMNMERFALARKSPSKTASL